VPFVLRFLIQFTRTHSRSSSAHTHIRFCMPARSHTQRTHTSHSHTRTHAHTQFFLRFCASLSAFFAFSPRFQGRREICDFAISPRCVRFAPTAICAFRGKLLKNIIKNDLTLKQQCDRGIIAQLYRRDKTA